MDCSVHPATISRETNSVTFAGSSNRQIFSGNNENFIKNGATLLQERLSLFDGRTNPVHCFSVDDINAMNVAQFGTGYTTADLYAGLSDAQSRSDLASREIAVATQMGNHTNVHRLLGCCLHTERPILVYESHDKEPLEWKDRLRVAWEIAHATEYLHTAFRRPIIHRNLKPVNVYLDQDDSATLSDFSRTVSIPEGKTHVEDCGVWGTFGYVALDYMRSDRVAESTDVYSFGILLLVLMTGKLAILDHPAINKNGVVAEEQLKTLVELALRCAAEDEECRPTMLEEQPIVSYKFVIID
ncbi:hypothetical protein RND81_10G108100 [Saponaria officinalis]|uniref:Protein kinase domain-containing protein n=1 Tax=Saponaria officinalis TaxID=3572 RepID=A0AAW1I028_SAPOF